MIFAAFALAASISTLDGDTFDLAGERIRIANMDAPETLQAKCDAELRLGKVAAARLAQLLGSGSLAIRRGDPALCSKSTKAAFSPKGGVTNG